MIVKENILEIGYIEYDNSGLKHHIPRNSEIIYNMFSSIYENREKFFDNTVVKRFVNSDKKIYLEIIEKPGFNPIYTINAFQDKNCIYVGAYMTVELLNLLTIDYYVKKC
jgi:hypothetical protein